MRFLFTNFSKLLLYIPAAIIVVKMDGPSYICKTDEVGEICVSSGVGGNGYWGLAGLTSSVFGVCPLDADGKTITDQCYTRSGLLGFLGPGGTFNIHK